MGFISPPNANNALNLQSLDCETVGSGWENQVYCSKLPRQESREGNNWATKQGDQEVLVSQTHLYHTIQKHSAVSNIKFI